MRFRRVLALSLFFVVGAIGLCSPLAAAEPGFSAGPPVAEDGLLIRGADEASRSGAFHGFDAALGVVWIDDHRYRLHPGAKVVGNSTKLGLASAIKHGEIVEFSIIPDSKDPRRKLILEIRRK